MKKIKDVLKEVFSQKKANNGLMMLEMQSKVGVKISTISNNLSSNRNHKLSFERVCKLLTAMGANAKLVIDGVEYDLRDFVVEKKR